MPEVSDRDDENPREQRRGASLTIKARRLLGEADAVVYDYLVAAEV